MRINYNILWVEDTQQWYEANLDLIKEFLEDYGFKVESTLCGSFDEVKNEYDKNQLKEYDVLFVDFKLSGSPDGDKIIDFIRSQDDNSILTDIIFYSSDIESVRDKLKENGKYYIIENIAPIENKFILYSPKFHIEVIKVNFK